MEIALNIERNNNSIETVCFFSVQNQFPIIRWIYQSRAHINNKNCNRKQKHKIEMQERSIESVKR